MCRYACDSIREIFAICGQKHHRSFTTENRDELQRPQNGCSWLERIDVFAFPHHVRTDKLNPELRAAQLGNEQQAYMLSEKSRYSSGSTN